MNVLTNYVYSCTPYSHCGLLTSSPSFQRIFELPFKSMSSHCYQFIIGLPLPACPFKLAQWYQTTGVIAGVGQLRLQINWFSEEVTAAAFKAWEMRKLNYRTSGIQYAGVSVMQELLHERCRHAHKSRFGKNSVVLGGKYSPQGHTSD